MKCHVVVERLVIAFVVAFIALRTFGHVLMFAALFAEPRAPEPKQTGTEELADAAWRLT
jgi:hypothetical protein